MSLMPLQYQISVCLFLCFAIAVFTRAAMLRRQGIRAIVFGETDKSDFFLLPFVLIMAYTVLANAFSLPIWPMLVRPFWQSVIPGWIGLALGVLALLGFVTALVGFGKSFRVGIDEVKPDALVTTGLFAISRNPIYVCFLLFFTGLFLVHANIVVALVGVLLALAIHRQVLREEKFLIGHYGAEYEAYCQKVRRYL